MDDRPREMFRNGRPVDPDFEPEEELYLRCLPDQVDGQYLLPTAIKFTNQSVNRGRYSKPEWVLIPDWLHLGIASFEVRDVPPTPESLGDVRYEFKVEHDPFEDNYAHSEIRTYKNGVYEPGAGKKVNSKVKQRFRAIVCDRARILRRPRVPRRG